MKPQQEIKSKVTKSDIAKAIKEIEDYGGLCLNFGDRRKGRTATIGKPDIEIIYKKCFAVIEVKVAGDTFKEKQIDYGLKFTDVRALGAYYLIVTENNYQEIMSRILNNDYTGLDDLEKGARAFLLQERKRLQELEIKREQKRIKKQFIQT